MSNMLQSPRRPLRAEIVTENNEFDDGGASIRREEAGDSGIIKVQVRKLDMSIVG